MTGRLHHIELYVSDLEASTSFWGWLLKELGYEEYQKWSGGRSWICGETYVVVVQAPGKHLDIPYHRRRAGLNHLAFHGESRASVDALTETLRRRGVPILYEDRHPWAGGEGHYAVFFEDPDRIKVEVEAPAVGEITANEPGMKREPLGKSGEKVDFPIDKRLWRPSLLPGPVFLVSTRSGSGDINIAPKSWIQMVSFEPPILMMSGAKGNRTESNIIETGDFVLNLVDSSMAERAFECIRWHGRERLDKTGFDFEASRVVSTPGIRQSRASIECRMVDTKEIGSGFVIFGEIVAVSVSAEIQQEGASGYESLDQILFLEDSLYCRVNKAESVRLGI